jgi:hypothetical protein
MWREGDWLKPPRSLGISAGILEWFCSFEAMMTPEKPQQGFQKISLRDCILCDILKSIV